MSAARLTEATDGNKTEKHEGKTRHINSSAAEVGEEELTDNTASDIAR